MDFVSTVQHVDNYSLIALKKLESMKRGEWEYNSQPSNMLPIQYCVQKESLGQFDHCALTFRSWFAMNVIMWTENHV